MANDREDPLFPNEEKSMLQKLLPPLILMAAFGGFVSLAIYAYKAGTQSVSEGELMVVEADNGPMKEAPADPGGMQFPNQDKTIFETFAANGGQTPPNVERVLPTPEEPMPKGLDTSGTTTWVNDKLTGQSATPAAPKTAATVEQVFSEDAAPSAAAPAPVAPEPKPEAKVVNVQEELGKQAVAEIAPAPVELQAAAPAPATPAAPKAPFNPPKKETAKKEEPKKIEDKPAAPKAAAKATTGKQLVQLGAYKDEAAARTDFSKLQKKYSALSGKTPTINRADLGDKGVFYRLRVATDDAKKLCAALAGHACMAVK